MATITDVAARAGVSKTTVSRYLNGRYDQMGAETRERIRRAIEDLGYRPNLLAASMKTKKTHTIGVLISNIMNPFFAGLVQAIEETASQAGYSAILASTGDDPEKEAQYVPLLRDRQVDGMICATSGANDALYRQLVDQGFPIVFVDRMIPSLPIPHVLLDNEKGVRHVLQYLARLGHRRIAVVSGRPTALTPRAERVQAFQKCGVALGLDVRTEYIAIDAPTEDGGYRAGMRLLGMAEPPTAVLSTINIMTLGLLQCCIDRGVKCPEQLSLITFDDVHWCKVVQPALTAVSQPVAEFGVHAISLLLQLIANKEGGETGGDQVIRLAPTLIVRDSCAPPAS